MPGVDEHYPVPKIIACADALNRAGIPYAFGGALMLIYWAEPRATTDIDINIFLPLSRVDDGLDVFRGMGIDADWDSVRDEIERTSQVRIDYDGTLVDLFFPFDPYHDECARRAVEKVFISTTIRILTAEDIVIFKCLFNRPKDWIDIETIIATQGERFDSEGDAALERLQGLIEEYRLNPA